MCYESNFLILGIRQGRNIQISRKFTMGGWWGGAYIPINYTRERHLTFFSFSQRILDVLTSTPPPPPLQQSPRFCEMMCHKKPGQKIMQVPHFLTQIWPKTSLWSILSTLGDFQDLKFGRYFQKSTIFWKKWRFGSYQCEKMWYLYDFLTRLFVTHHFTESRTLL